MTATGRRRSSLLYAGLALLVTASTTGCSRLVDAQARFFAASHYNRAVEAYIQHRHAAAQRELRKSLRFDPSHPEANLLLAQLYLRDEKYAEASECLRRARKHVAEDSPDVLFTLADLYDRAGKYAEAEATYRKAYRGNPTNPVAQNNLGYFLANRDRKLDEALKLIRSAVKSRPHDGSFVDSLGWVQYRRGSLDEASKLLSRAKELDPDTAEIHYHLGIVYRDLNRADDARTEFLHAFDRDPDFQLARDELRKLGEDPRNPHGKRNETTTEPR